MTQLNRAVGDFFYRHSHLFLCGIFGVCLYIIVQVKFEITPFFVYSVYADGVNEILVNLSFSYIAAYIFYQLTSRLLLKIRNRKTTELALGTGGERCPILHHFAW